MNQFSDILGPDGLVAKVLSNYEYRPAQLEMASVVAAAMEEQKSALIEAGTGIGKTLAYLVPMVCLGLRCVISTGTKNLQGQIIRKDIPFLERCFGKRIKAYSLKGRGNYLCLRRWKQFSSNPGLNFTGVVEGLMGIKKWQMHTNTGDHNELEWLSENDPLWSEICSTTDTCWGLKCKDYEKCFVTRARQEAAGADLVVVNHHLLMADCCLRIRSNTSAIPAYSRLVLDEAHMLEQVATEYFGLGVSNNQIQELTRNIRREVSEANLEDAELARTLERIKEKSSAFFGSIQTRDERFSINDRIIGGDTKKRLLDVISLLMQLSSNLERIGIGCDPILLCYKKAKEIQSSLDFICDHNDSDFVFWGERRKNAVSLKVSPIDISDQLVAHLFKPLKGLVLTSATLSTDQDFNYIKTRLGLASDFELILESHFDYNKQAVIFNPKGMPRPDQNEFLEQLGPQISRILHITRGRALLLFTSYRNLDRAYHYLKGEGLGYKLLKQGEGPKEYLLDEFWNDITSILLATSSFWQGVDIPGEALSCVVIDRLPFSVPTDPITEARINWIRNRGGNPFQEYQLPSAIITLKQGLGRLIRHRQDRGLLVILDSRTYTKSYGKIILKNLPKCPVVRSLDEAVKLIKQLKII